MPALIGNLSIGETLVLATIAVLVFGRNLPQVAGQVVRWLAKARSSLWDLRRETGIDREFHSIRHTVEDATRRATVDVRPPPPPGRDVGGAPREPDPPVADADESAP